MIRSWSEGFEHLKKPQTLVGLLLAAVLLRLGFALPLAFAVGIHLAITLLTRKPAGEEARAGGAIWGLAALFSLVLITCLQFVLLTRATGEILGPELLSGSFDSLAQGLLRGTSEVDPDAIRWEAIVVEGRTYFYFGPWPAFLRMPLQWLAPELYGQWARLSCFAASALCLAAFALLSLRMLEKNLGLNEQEKRFVLVTSLLAFGLASPLFFLMKDAPIYHESVLWGLAGSVCFLSVLVPNLDAPEALRQRLPLLSTIAGVAFLSRVTYGGPLYLILLLIAGNELVRHHQRDQRGGRAIGAEAGRLVLAMLPAGLLLVFHLWYNFDRFDSIFEFADIRLLSYVDASPPTLELLDRVGVLNLRRLPSALQNYSIPSAAMFSDQFPWFRVAAPHYPDPDLYPRIFPTMSFHLRSCPRGWCSVERSAWLTSSAAPGVASQYCAFSLCWSKLCSFVRSTSWSCATRWISFLCSSSDTRCFSPRCRRAPLCAAARSTLRRFSFSQPRFLYS